MKPLGYVTGGDGQRLKILVDFSFKEGIRDAMHRYNQETYEGATALRINQAAANLLQQWFFQPIRDRMMPAAAVGPIQKLYGMDVQRLSDEEQFDIAIAMMPPEVLDRMVAKVEQDIAEGKIRRVEKPVDLEPPSFLDRIGQDWHRAIERERLKARARPAPNRSLR